MAERTEAQRRAERSYRERHGEARLVYLREYMRRFRLEKRDEHNRRSNAHYKAYLERYPDKKFLWRAKEQIGRQLGVRWSQIPPELAEARAALLKARDAVRKAREA